MPDSSHPSQVPSQVLPTRDGWIVVMCDKEKFYRELVQAFGAPELGDDPRFSSFASRLENRDVWVVPMVMITEGVHNGAQGPIYYPGEELARYAKAWDGKPVVVYHPQMTANSKEIYDKQKIGVIMNTTWDKVGRRLTAEA